MLKIINIVATMFAWCLIVGSIAAIPVANFYISVWRSPCTEVYDGNKLIYSGNSYFYQTESRGTGTIFKEYEAKLILPRQLQEIQSNAITIKTIKCEER